MQPGVEKLPQWIQSSAGLIVLALILLGGFWLQTKEKRDRALEKERLLAQTPENSEPNNSA